MEDTSAPLCFLSYSRRDLDEKTDVCAALQASGGRVTGDWDIPSGGDWWLQVCELIARADVFVLLATPTAMQSRTVLNEIDRATELGKRLVAVVGRDGIDEKAVPAGARRPNWLFLPKTATGSTPDVTFVDRVGAAIFTDFEDASAHTQLLMAAHAWVAEGKPNGRLLRGAALNRADALLGRLGTIRNKWQPIPTEGQRQFVRCGRRAQVRRRVSATVATVALAAAALGGYTLFQRQAEAAALESYSRRLAARAPSLLTTRPDQALLMAVVAAKHLPDAPEAETAMRQALAMMPKATSVLCDRAAHSPILDRSRRVLAIGCHDGVRVYDLRTNTLLRTLTGLESFHTMALTPDGRQLVARLPGTLRTYEIETGEHSQAPEFDRFLPELGSTTGWPAQEPVREALSPNARYAATIGGAKLFLHTLHQRPDRPVQQIPLPFVPHRVVFSADDEFVGVSTPYGTYDAAGRFQQGGALLIHIPSLRQTQLIDEPVEELSIGSDSNGRVFALVGQNAAADGRRTTDLRFSLFVRAKGGRFERLRSLTVPGDPQLLTKLVTTDDGRVLVWHRFQVTAIYPVPWTVTSESENAAFANVALGDYLTSVVTGGGCAGAGAAGDCTGATIRIFDRNGQVRYWTVFTANGARVAVVSQTQFVIASGQTAWLAMAQDDRVLPPVAHAGIVDYASFGSTWWASHDSTDTVRVMRNGSVIDLEGTAISVTNDRLAIAQSVADDAKAPIEIRDMNTDVAPAAQPTAIAAAHVGRVAALSLSPDGRRIAMSVQDPSNHRRSHFAIVDVESRSVACAMSEPLVDSLLWSAAGEWLGVKGPRERSVRDLRSPSCGFLAGTTFTNRALAGVNADGTEMVLAGPSRNGGPSLLVDLSRRSDYSEDWSDNNPGNLNIEDVDKAAFSSDQRVAVSTGGGAIHILRRKDRTILQSIHDTGRVHAMRFADGSTLEVLRGAAELRHIRYTVLPKEALLAEACARSARKSLQNSEWQELAGSAPLTPPCPDGDEVALGSAP